MANKNLTSFKDQQRLLSKIEKLKDHAWMELNEISATDPKSHNRRIVYQSFKNLFIELGGKF